MPDSTRGSDGIRKKIQKFAIIASCTALVFSVVHLTDVYPSLNALFLVIVLIATVLAVTSGLLLYVSPDKEWHHDGI